MATNSDFENFEYQANKKRYRFEIFTRNSLEDSAHFKVL